MIAQSPEQPTQSIRAARFAPLPSPALAALAESATPLWFVTIADGDPPWSCVRMARDLTLMGRASGEPGLRRHTLRVGGAIGRSACGRLQALQPEYFAAGAYRAFSDGTRICANDASAFAQSLEMQRLSARLGASIAALRAEGTLSQIVAGARHRRRTEELSRRTEELRAHILDLAVLQR